MNGNAATITSTQGIRVLYHSETFWMSDARKHDHAMKDLADQAHGHVLVGGYGLGLVQRHLVNNPRVASVLTAEINCDVIRAVLDDDGWIWGRVWIGDFFAYEPGNLFDTVIGDTWADATDEYRDEFERFKLRAPRLIKPGGTVLAWTGDGGFEP